MSDLLLETVVARRAEPLTARVDDDLVMLDPRQSLYYGLDSVGRRIWELLEQPRSVGALCGTLQAEFDVPADTCQADVRAFIQQMSEAELVEIR